MSMETVAHVKSNAVFFSSVSSAHQFQRTNEQKMNRIR